MAIFGALIKLDIGGFGSGILRPILKDVPVVNLILPGEMEARVTQENSYGYKSMAEAVAKIQELEAALADMENGKTNDDQSVQELQAEVDRLKVFEEEQKAFEERTREFDKNVVFAEAAPDIEEYKKYYEQINPTTAEELYRQVVEQLQYSDAIKAKADIYRNMDPGAAAQILETMTADIGAVSEILLSMRPRESAAILAEMDQVVAAKITKKMLDMDEEKLSSSQ